MKNRLSTRVFGLLALFAFYGFILQAQERNDVIKAYNEGAKVMQTDFPAAIKAFENAITLANKVGETAKDLKQNAEKVLPGLYVKVALSAVNEKKPAQEVVQAAKTALQVSEKLNNATGKENANRILVQGYNSLTAELFGKKDYDNALKTTDSLLSINPEFVSAINNRALIYRAQGNSDAFEKTVDTYIEKVKKSNDTVKAKQASTMALEYFRAAGSKASQANNLPDALSLLNRAAKYGNDKDLFYYFSDVYNKQKNFDKGLEFGQKGLAMETGQPEAKAKFYFQIATAQFGKGQTAEACASYKNAMFGAFAEASKVQIGNLKCK